MGTMRAQAVDEAARFDSVDAVLLEGPHELGDVLQAWAGVL